MFFFLGFSYCVVKCFFLFSGVSIVFPKASKIQLYQLLGFLKLLGNCKFQVFCRAFPSISRPIKALFLGFLFGRVAFANLRIFCESFSFDVCLVLISSFRLWRPMDRVSKTH